MTKTPKPGSVTQRPVEFQMRFKQLLARATEGGDAPLPEPGELGPFVAISRQSGSEGAEVGRAVGARLGWSVLDRELVEEMARRLELTPNLVELMDETRSNWFSETLLNLMNSRLVSQDSYVALLGKVMALAALDGRVVIVGRGSTVMLPRERGLTVRTVASREFRIETVSRQEGLAGAAAERRVDELESSRSDFIRRHFHHDVNDCQLYDMVVNVSAFGVEGAAELICRAVELRDLG